MSAQNTVVSRKGFAVIPDGAAIPVFQVNQRGDVYFAGTLDAQSGDANFEWIALGSNPAKTGAIRMSNNTEMYFRSSTGLDMAALSVPADNILYIGNSGFTSIIVNGGSGDCDFTIRSDSNNSHFVSDAGLFGGVGAFGFGSSAQAGISMYVSFPARSAPANQNTAIAEFTGSAGALTIPAGTTSVVATASFSEPNITATGTVTLASTVYINNAPTEGTTNFAQYIAAGTFAARGRANHAQGSSVASASQLTLGEGNHFIITGTTAINTITTTGWLDGAKVTLAFASAGATIANAASAAGLLAANVLMGSAGTYTARANDCVTLILTSTGASTKSWYMTGGGL